MDFNLAETEKNDILLLTDNTPDNVPSFSYGFDVNIFTKDYNTCNDVVMTSENESSDNFEPLDSNQTSAAADDLLRNGILVETSKGLVCMSLKDVLSANLNLSVEDFKKVAAQLLSQQEKTVPVSPTTEQNETICKSDNKESSSLTDASIFPTVSKSYSFDIEMKSDYSQKIMSFPLSVAVKRPSSDNSNVEELSDTVASNNENQSSSAVTSEALDTSEETEKEKEPFSINIVPKRRGGWPKGRKRKPELLNLPPKAPKTSYNIFLNERRKLYKDKLAFHEITRVVGNQWSNLSSEAKKPYIERAEEDKKRYREELRIYRQSDAYKLYLARKRKKRAMDNLMSESDMDGTDDIDDEDNDMLYCDMCDQWFYNMHNKREHLLSRQHKMLVAGDMTRKLASSENKDHNISVCPSTSLDESSMDGTPIETDSSVYSKDNSSKSDGVYDCMVRLLDANTKREKEIQVLSAQLKESVWKQNAYISELNSLKEKVDQLNHNLARMKEEETEVEQLIFKLWNVPSLFVMNNFDIVNNAQM